MDTFPEWAVSRLIVILQKGDEGRGRQCSARFTASDAATVGGWFALVAEALGQTASQVPDGSRFEIRMVAVRLAGEQDMQHMLEVVVPLCGVVSRTPVPVAEEIVRRVVVILQDQVYLRSRPGPWCTAAASSSRKSGAESSLMASTASSRKPLKWYSSSQ